MKKIFLLTVFGLFLLSWNYQLIELEKKQILNGKVEILLPKKFSIMPDDMLKLKYPAENRPALAYSDGDGTVNVAFNHTPSKASQAQIETYKDLFISTFKSAYPSAEWQGNGIRFINGKKVGFLELITPAVDTKVYNLIFFTDVEGSLLICTFNCTVEKKSEWLETGKKIFNSLVVN